MLKTKNKVLRILLLVIMIGIALGIVADVRNIIDSNATVWMRAGAASAIAALLFAMYYILTGYSKNERLYYKYYILLYALSQVFYVVGFCVEEKTLLSVVSSSMILSFVLVLIIGKDLGKRNSYAFCGIILLLSVAFFISGLIQNPSFESGTSSILSAIRNAIQLLLAAIASVMTYAKYIDKEKRGRA